MAEKTNGEWRIRCNHELYQLHNNPEIIQEIKATRFRWLAFLFCANKLHPCRKITFTNPDSKRKVGRSYIRWMVLKTLKEVELRTVKQRQRNEWLGEASLRRSRPELGCRANMHKWKHIMVSGT